MLPLARRLTLTLLSGVFVAGCQFAPVALDPNALNGVTQIALTGPPEPPRYEFLDEGQFWNGIAVLSTMIGIQQGAAGFAAEAQEKGFLPGQEARAAIITALKGKGFDVSYFDAPRGNLVAYSFASNYKASPANAQLILDVSVQLGYANTSSDDFIPGVGLITRLVERKSGKIVMVKKFNFRGAYKDGGPTEDLIADARCNYANLQEINNSPDRAIACFRDGIKELAQKLAANLKQ